MPRAFLFSPFNRKHLGLNKDQIWGKGKKSYVNQEGKENER